MANFSVISVDPTTRTEKILSNHRLESTAKSAAAAVRNRFRKNGLGRFVGGVRLAVVAKQKTGDFSWFSKYTVEA